MNKIFKVLISIFICQLAGIIGSFFTAPAISQWYAFLEKPSLAPPNWIFAPVWTTLFLLMGISLYLVWDKGIQLKKVRIAMVIFFVHLGLNILWSFLFFGLRSPFYGFIEILILWFFILLTIFSFFKVSKKAGLILLPYLVWTSFAAFLNFFIWRINL